MMRSLFFSVLMVVLIFLATSICFAGPGKSKGSSNTNKQSLEISKRGKERAEQRHQMKEEKKIGNEGDDAVDDDGDEGKGKKVKKDKKKDKESKKKGKGKKDKDIDDDDNEKDDDSVDDEDESSGEKLQKETKS